MRRVEEVAVEQLLEVLPLDAVQPGEEVVDERARGVRYQRPLTWTTVIPTSAEAEPSPLNGCDAVLDRFCVVPLVRMVPSRHSSPSSGVRLEYWRFCRTVSVAW